MAKIKKIERRLNIKKRVRKVVSGTATRPRMSVFRSNKQIYVQLIDDIAGRTLVAASSRENGIEDEKLLKSNRQQKWVLSWQKKQKRQASRLLCSIVMVICIMVE